MASMAMSAASFTAAAPTAAAGKHLRRGVVAVRASLPESEKMVKEENKGRRDLVFGVTAAAAAALCSVAVAVAEEPKRGTVEARKKYSPVCVTMPTARICHN